MTLRFMVTRVVLNNLGRTCGVRRRWFGLEPNRPYRARIIKALLEQQLMRHMLALTRVAHKDLTKPTSNT